LRREKPERGRLNGLLYLPVIAAQEKEKAEQQELAVVDGYIGSALGFPF
jgi:hypothetical protein